MKTLLINGSPNAKNTTSGFLLNELKQKLDSDHQIMSYEISRDKDNKIANDIVQNLSNTDNIVIAYPLYLDSIPANLLCILKLIEDNMDKNHSSIYVYQIVNNGFYDADQNSKCSRYVMAVVQKVWDGKRSGTCSRCRTDVTEGIY